MCFIIFFMANRGFTDNQNSIEMSNNVGLAEKSSKEDSVRVSRVDINVLKSKLQKTQTKEFKKNLILISLLILGLISLAIFLSI